MELTLKQINLKQASELTGEPAGTIRKRVKRSGIPYQRDSHGELTFPLVAALPAGLAERVFRSLYLEKH